MVGAVTVSQTSGLDIPESFGFHLESKKKASSACFAEEAGVRRRVADQAKADASSGVAQYQNQAPLVR
jgi:hypothetical protein